MILQGLQIRAAFYFANPPAPGSARPAANAPGSAPAAPPPPAGRWVWVEWFATGSKHAAIIRKGDELRADAWDLGQAEATLATRLVSRGHAPAGVRV